MKSGPLTALGCTCHEVETDDAPGPILIADYHEAADLPTVLCYGHGDVTPGEDGRWSAGRSPWRLSESQGRWYGRGTADNKGQHTINLAALRAVRASRGRLGFNLKFIFEMGEELGSPGLRAVCLAHRDRLAADILLASDGSRHALDAPTLVIGTRGAVTFDIVIDARDGPLHPGAHGGIMANPAIELAHTIAALVDAKGRILAREIVPADISAPIRHVLRDVRFAAGEDLAQPDGWWGEPGLSTAEKLYAWSSLDVLAMSAGDPEHPANAIPPSAWARCQLRFPVDVAIGEVLPALRRHLDKQGLTRARIVQAGIAPFNATRLEPDHPWVAWATTSLQQTLAPGTLTIVPGGSAPSDIIEETLGLPALWVPHGYPGAHQHAPDEHMPIALARQALAMMAGLFWDLGEPQVRALVARAAQPATGGTP